MDDLKGIQRQYFDLISDFDITEIEVDFYSKAVALIDKCEAFWLSKKQQISLILNDLTEQNKSFLLSSAIYLDVKENGHYTFGALGDTNILNDPIVRMRGFSQAAPAKLTVVLFPIFVMHRYHKYFKRIFRGIYFYFN